MTLARRITTLEQMVPRSRLGRPVPDDPVAFARGLLAGEFVLTTLILGSHRPD